MMYSNATHYTWFTWCIQMPNITHGVHDVFKWQTLHMVVLLSTQKVKMALVKSLQQGTLFSIIHNMPMLVLGFSFQSNSTKCNNKKLIRMPLGQKLLKIYRCNYQLPDIVHQSNSTIRKFQLLLILNINLI